MGALTVVLATANRHKVSEITAALASSGVNVILLPRPLDAPDVLEDADTLEGNARRKAAAVGEWAGAPALADDTGLFVDALHGQPGVQTAYFAGMPSDDAANRAKLLRVMADERDRGARFRTVVMMRFPDGRELVAEGAVEGSIATEERGPAGFGYDALFIPAEGDGRTFAEMAPAEKNAISHRARAVRAMAALFASSANIADR